MNEKKLKETAEEKSKAKESKKNKEKEKLEDAKKVEVPEGFTKKTNLNKKEYGYHNGRKYLKLKNGYGMWADTGQGFNLSDLD